MANLTIICGPQAVGKALCYATMNIYEEQVAKK